MNTLKSIIVKALLSISLFIPLFGYANVKAVDLSKLTAEARGYLASINEGNTDREKLDIAIKQLVSEYYDQGEFKSTQWNTVGEVERMRLNIGLIEEFINAGANIGAHRQEILTIGASARYLSSKGQKLVQIALDHGADINARYGEALYMASSRFHYDMIKILLERGANPNLADGKAFIALFNTSTDDYWQNSPRSNETKTTIGEIFDLFFKKGLNPRLGNGKLKAMTLLYLDAECIKSAIENGVFTKDEYAEALVNALQVSKATSNFESEVFEYLIRVCADEHLFSTDVLMQVLAAVRNLYDREATKFGKLLVNHGNFKVQDSRVLLAMVDVDDFHDRTGVLAELLKVLDKDLKIDDAVLLKAVESGRRDSVKVLLDHGMNINAKNGEALVLAARAIGEYWATDMLEILLKHGIKVSQQVGEDALKAVLSQYNDVYGRSNLEYKSKTSKALMAILQCVPDISKSEKQLLLIAVEHRDDDLLEYLITRGVQIDSSVILTAVDFNVRLATLKTLLEALHKSYKIDDEVFLKAVERGYVDGVEMLLEYGVDVNARNGVALVLTAKMSNELVAEIILKVLLKNGLNVNQQAGIDALEILLTRAPGYYRDDTVLMLIVKNMNDISEFEKRLLDYATKHGYAYLLNYLVERGLDKKKLQDPALLLKTVDVPYHADVDGARGDTLKILLSSFEKDFKLDEDVFLRAVARGNIACTKILLELGMNVNARNGEALTLAVGIKDAWDANNTLRFLIENGINMDLSAGNNAMEQVIFWYVTFPNYVNTFRETLRLVMTHMNDITQFESRIVNAVVQKCDPELLKYIIEKKIDVTKVNRSSLLKAMNYPCDEVVQLLISNGLDLSAVSIDNLDIEHVLAFSKYYPNHLQNQKFSCQQLIDYANTLDQYVFENLIKLKYPHLHEIFVQEYNGYAKDFRIVFVLEHLSTKEEVRMIGADYINLMVSMCSLRLWEYLIECGVDLRKISAKSLIEAMRGCDDVVHLLIKNGLDLSKISVEGMSIKDIFLFLKYYPNHLQNMYFSSEQLIEFAQESSAEEFKKLIKIKYADLFDIYLKENPSITQSGNILFVAKHLSEGRNYAFIGFNNIGGAWSSNLFKYIQEEGKRFGNVIVIPISPENTQDEVFLSNFTAFVNPGNGDTYPKNMAEFNYNDYDKGQMMPLEIAYQNVINYAKKHSLPYLGICAGNQHLILNSEGYLQPVTGYHGSVSVKFLEGTMPYLLTLNPEEQVRALNQCVFEKVEIKQGYVAHNFAGVAKHIGNIQLGATYENETVAAAVAYGAIKYGFQFHPENGYDTDYKDDKNIPLQNRHINIIRNFVTMVHHYQRNIQLGKKYGISADQVKKNMEDTYQFVAQVLQDCKDVNGGGEGKKEKTALPVFFQNLDSKKDVRLTEKEIVNLVIRALPDVNPKDVGVSREGGDLIIFTKKSGEVLKIADYFNACEGSSCNTQIKFANGHKQRLFTNGTLISDISVLLERN